MSSIVKFLMTLLSLITACEASAQGWTKLENLPDNQFSAIEVIDGTLFTASGTTLYTSGDQGATWEESEFTSDEDITVICFTKFGTTIYAGTTDGVYSAPVDDVHSEWNHDIFTLPVSSFAEKDGTLYASIYGFGVMKLNGTAWMNFSAGLPNTSQNASKIVNASGELFVMAGGNGAFYKYDFTAGQWVEDFYYGTIEAGLEINDALFYDGTLYASSQHKLLRSDDLGENWAEDMTGLIAGTERLLHKGQDKLYTYTLGGGGTKINSRLLAAAGETWADNSETVPCLGYSLRESGDKLFLAAEDGVYTSDIVLGIDPVTQFANTVIYPNPAIDGNLTLQTDLTIDKMSIYDVTGRIVIEKDNFTGIEQFSLPAGGFYLIELTAGNAITTKKITTQ